MTQKDGSTSSFAYAPEVDTRYDALDAGSSLEHFSMQNGVYTRKESNNYETLTEF